MVKETVVISFKRAIHIPELPPSIEERIERYCNWKVLERNDEYMTLRSKKENASIVSSLKEIRSACIGEYGKNYKPIKSIEKAIKGVTKVSKIDLELGKCLCAAAITCEAIPTKVRNLNNLTYTPVPERNLIIVPYVGAFNGFPSNFYKHTHSKAFKFSSNPLTV